MIIDREKLSIKEFLSVFDKKFKNFCSKAPVYISYKTTPQSVILTVDTKDYNTGKNELIEKEFFFELAKGVKQNIKQIKDWLIENSYPLLCEKIIEEQEYSSIELKEMVDLGKISIDEIDSVKKTKVYDNIHRIEKVIIDKGRDEIFIRNLTTNKLFHYELKVPVLTFLNKIENYPTREEAFEYFKQKSQLIENTFYKQKETLPINYNN